MGERPRPGCSAILGCPGRRSTGAPGRSLVLVPDFALERFKALYWRDRHVRFHRYDRVPATRHMQELLDVIAGSSDSIFWGWLPLLASSANRRARALGVMSEIPTVRSATA
ncbi:DUF3024 domain-containing protein [Frondihabitans peucedani]|uniref:DUF3024 domain-containing protein n=1 Tax=Frondihabitans peucedani TaxID=598626 RepID=UPI003CD056B5